MIIGVTGTIGAGKGTVVEALVEKGFKHYSVRAYLNEEIKQRGMPLNRNSQISVANDLRAKNSSSYIAEQLYAVAKQVGGDCIIESLRTVGEIEALRKKGEFFLIAVDADRNARYTRNILRNSETDNITFDEFKEKEDMEMISDNPAKQNLRACIEEADFTIINNGTKEEMKNKVEAVLEKIEKKKTRPSWDEYFMGICEKVAERCTCDRGKGGTVIVRDKRILTTGYIGSPPGIPHCDEEGHLLKTVKHDDGKETTHCMRTIHCELNAILQAAKLGIPLEGSTLYTFKAPCRNCAMAIISCGIKRVVAKMRYHGDFDTAALFKEAGVKFEVLSQEVAQYDNQ